MGHPSNVPSLVELNVDMVKSSEGRVASVKVREQMPVCYDLDHIGRYICFYFTHLVYKENGKKSYMPYILSEFINRLQASVRVVEDHAAVGTPLCSTALRNRSLLPGDST